MRTLALIEDATRDVAGCGPGCDVACDTGEGEGCDFVPPDLVP